MKTTRLARHGNEVVLVLDEAMLEELGLDENSQVEVSKEDDRLVMRPVTGSDRQGRLGEILDELDEQYSDVFRRLAE